jgi:hypothetical protein
MSSESPAHGLRFPFDAPRGDPDRVYARQLQILDPEWISLEGGTSTVRIPPVDFNSEALGLPVGVDLMPGNEVVDGRLREACFIDQGEEETLRVDATKDGIAVDGNGLLETVASRVSTGTGKDRIEAVDVEQAPVLGFLDDRLEPPGSMVGG